MRHYISDSLNKTHIYALYQNNIKNVTIKRLKKTIESHKTMKKTVTTLILLSLSLFADIKFVQKYEDGLAEAQKENKLIALTVVSTNCPWCHKLLETTLKDKRVEDIINKNFVYVLVNKDITTPPSGMTARLVPATFFLDKNGRKVSLPAIGYWDADDFIGYLNDALKKAKKL